ncbi:periplasmic heavy metal sensor [Phaeobacter sp. C3_T13_0]|uniref:periplasmic heavy metal sensor n=1 Tax=Phaeobacter cretensis TaxID=3342641 RepID=UPI0039BD35F7
MSNEQPKTQPERRRWVRWLLIASLGLNLAVIGIVVGAAWRFSDHKKGFGMPPPIGAMLFRDLDADTRHSLRSEAEAGHGSYRGRRRAEGVMVVDLLRATPFDEAALSEMLDTLAERRHGFQQSVQTAWLGHIGAMSAEERAEYAERLEQRIQHPKRRKPRD